ncbi:MAG: tetratricopeptide repeat protein [Bacteroidetes bacterium]|nr:tetratricopeptide repeat protein [Bacteroidota bacterium]
MKSIKIILLVLAFLYLGNIKNLEANINADSTFIAVLSMPNDTNKVISLFDLAASYKDDKRLALQIVDSALVLSKSLNYYNGIAQSCLFLGSLNTSIGDYPASLGYLLEGMSYLNFINDSVLIGKLYNELAYTYSMQGPENFPKAINLNLQALEMQVEVNDIQGIARSYTYLGYLYSDPISETTLDKNKALDYFIKALDYNKMLNNVSAQASIISSIGFTYFSMDNYTEALKYVEKSLEMYKLLNNKRGEMNANYRAGIIHRAIKNYSKSIYYLEKTITDAIESDNKDLANNAYEALSRTLI